MFRPPPEVRLLTDLTRTDAVCADGGQLAFAVGCLLENAGQACLRGGDGVTRGTIRVRTFDDGTTVGIDVSDDGAGVDPSVQLRIFDPFFTTRGVASAGLGLSMARAIARAAKGDVHLLPARPEARSDGRPEARSDAIGATFRLGLPRTP
jgi:signal transduction histidine kinase